MNTKSCIQWLWKASKGCRTPILFNGVLGILNVCISLLFIWTTKYLVDIATGHTAGNLTTLICLMIICMILRVSSNVLITRISVKNITQLRNKLRQKLFERTMQSKWTGKEKHHTGDVLNRMEEDVQLATTTICISIPNTLIIVIQLIAAFTFLLSLQAKLAWSLIFIMPIALVTSKVYMKRMRKLTKAIRTTDSQVQSHIQEHIQHRNLIRSLEQSQRSQNTLISLQTTLLDQEMRRVDFTLFSRTAIQIGFTAGYATAFLWGIFGLQDGTVTFGMMTAFLQLVMQVQRPIVDLSKQVPSFVNTLTSAERLAELDNLPQEEKGEPVLLTRSIGIRMDNVNFSYPDATHQVIRNFNYNFEPNSITAIVGETGAGKSTLIRLMLSLLKQQQGNITLYNNDRQIPASPLTRCNLVYVPQGNTLMSGTIKDNLLLGNPNATDEQLKEALHTAVADFVWELPDNINTQCGEGGSGLSEGQAQRIAIARGLLRNGGIMLLDEPTSALDNDTQNTLMTRLKDIAQGKTIIIITHNPDISKWVDKIVKIERVHDNDI